MLEITIIEGCRGTGKSTIASRLRQTTSETTLINFTGFHADGEEGLSKVLVYYKSFLQMFNRLSAHDSKFIFDRFFFSEMIYSQLYKDYDFTDCYFDLLDNLELLTQIGVKINIFYLTINDEEELRNRLMRDKVPFGKAEESVRESLRQQTLYSILFDSLYENRAIKNSNLNIYEIDTSGLTTDEIYNEILQFKTTE